MVIELVSFFSQYSKQFQELEQNYLKRMPKHLNVKVVENTECPRPESSQGELVKFYRAFFEDLLGERREY